MYHAQARIQDFLVEGDEQGRNHGSKVGRSEPGEARIEGAKRPSFEGEARIEGEARERAGGGVWGGGSVSPSPGNFWNFELQIV